MMRTTMLGITALLLGGCQDGGQPAAEAEAFHYDLTQTSGLDLECHTAGGPLAGVLVSVRTAAASPTIAGELLWVGITGADGHARASFRTEKAGDAPLDIVLNKAGFSGAYANEAQRSAAGIFAPSARIAIPLDQMGAVSVALEQGS